MYIYINTAPQIMPRIIQKLYNGLSTHSVYSAQESKTNRFANYSFNFHQIELQFNL